jgi:hypothetical protein
MRHPSPAARSFVLALLRALMGLPSAAGLPGERFGRLSLEDFVETAFPGMALEA